MIQPTEKELSHYPIVALVGRVNVGKSTLFNRLIEERKAVTAPVPGTTRDVNYGFCRWQGRVFAVADTGGFIPKPSTEIEKKVFAHVQALLKRASLILFVVDVKAGLHPDDISFLKQIRKVTKAQILYVANKADKLSEVREANDKEWLRAGMGAPVPVSAANGVGVGDLLEEVIKYIPEKDQTPEDKNKPLRIAVIGRTNVGKSSLLNKILGEDRVIVSDQAHTTREPQDTYINYKDRPICIIDTVGIRKKSRVAPGLERDGVMRSIKNIQKADIVILVLESIVSTSKQESRLASIAIESGAGIILVVNKWDLVEEKDTKSVNAFESYFKTTFEFIAWAPIMFISALSGQRTQKILDLVLSVDAERSREISQEALNDFLNIIIAKQKPTWIRGKKKPIIYGIRQSSTCPPRFMVLVNSRLAVSFAYLRYIENRLRDTFGFEGTSVQVYTEEKV